MRKILVFAFLLALTAVVPVRASAMEVVMGSEIALVEVTVPQTGRIVLNPYGLPVETAEGVTTEQIVSEAVPVVNNDSTPVTVSVRAVGRVSEGSSMVCVSAPPLADTLEKEVFLYAEFQPEDGLWTGSYCGGANQILITEAASEAKDVLTLDAASQGVFRIFGAASTSPADPWGSEDQISVTITFSFEPVVEPGQDVLGDEESPVPEVPEEPEVPPEPELPEEPEVPEPPETPSEPETPVTPEEPPATEVPVTPEFPAVPAPEDPMQPPAWIPVQPPEQVPPVMQIPAETPIQTPQAEPPVIDVVVPNTGTVIINPYGLPVEIDGQETTEQIAGSTMLLENRGNVAVDVSVNAVGIALGGVVFAAEPPAGSTLEKEVFLYAEFQATEALGQTVPWQDFFSDAPNQILVTPYGSNKDGVMRLEAAETPYSYGATRLFGSVSAYPAQSWEAGDGFHVNLAFTFTPVIPEVPILDAPSGTGVDSTLVLPADPNVMPDWIIPSEPVVEPGPVVTPDPVMTPDPAVTPDPIETPEPAVPSETVPEAVPDESTVPVPSINDSAALSHMAVLLGG